jgi:SanA protein
MDPSAHERRLARRHFRMHRRTLWTIAVLLVVFTVLGVAALLFVDLRVVRIGRTAIREPEGKKYDCLLVLGALVYGDVPSPMLKDRLDGALAAYRAGLSDRILVSGDHGQADYDEVNAMRIYLEDAGVPPEAIFLDHAGFDTYDSLYRARDVFEVRSVLICTQRFHLLRALYIADRLGLSATGVDTTYRKYGRDAWYEVREIPARFKSYLDCEILHSLPTFLGEKIPISGSGLATRDESFRPQR